MNAVVEFKSAELVASSGRMAATEVVQHAKVVQEVMRDVMKAGLHFGKIPGMPPAAKPMLMKPGADVLCMTFRIAPKFVVESIGGADSIGYRVTCIGVHQTTGVDLGSGLGEASTDEEKYRWRKAVCKEEFEATPATMRRVKFAKGKNDTVYTVEQVRTQPADLANTVLKMAAKRAHVAMVLNVTAAGDMFGQDLEDLDATLRESLVEDEGGGGGLTPAQLAVRNESTVAVSAAKALADLQPLGKTFTPKFKANGDREGYDLFAAAVQAKAAALRAAQPATATDVAAARAAESTRDPFTAPTTQPVDGGQADPWLADFEAAERGGAPAAGGSDA